jgi:hypothetical protein
MIKKILIFSTLVCVSAFSQNPTRLGKLESDSVYVKNLQGKIGILNDESATPNISGAERWQIYYDTPVTITALRGMSSAVKTRVVFLEVTWNNITFTNSSTLDCGGIDLTFVSGDVIKAQWTGTKWIITAEFLSN